MIGFIGLGNMAKAIIGGIIESKSAAPAEICGSAKTEGTRKAVAEQFGIETSYTNLEVARKSDILFLAVKPQFFAEVIDEIKEAVSADTLIISIAAGKTLDGIESAFGKKCKIIRSMPNTPALVGAGCTGVCANERVSKDDMARAKKLLEGCGMVSDVPERLMDAFGAESGCSPAFVFMFIEAMADGAVAAGIPRAQAYEYAAQAVYGSAKLMLDTGKHPGQLKDMVCSPGGSTIEGVRVLEEAGLRASLMDAIDACVEKSKALR